MSQTFVTILQISILPQWISEVIVTKTFWSHVFYCRDLWRTAETWETCWTFFWNVTVVAAVWLHRDQRWKSCAKCECVSEFLILILLCSMFNFHKIEWSSTWTYSSTSNSITALPLLNHRSICRCTVFGIEYHLTAKIIILCFYQFYKYVQNMK